MVGFNFNRPVFITTPGIGNFVQLTNTSDFYIGTQLMDYDVALRVSLGRDGFNRDSTLGVPALDESATYLEFGGGFSSDNIDASLSFELPKIKSEMGNLTDEWSGTGINVMGRYFYELNEQMQAVPTLEFGTSSTSRKTDQAGGLPQLETDFSVLSLNAGIGLNYQLNKDNLIVLAVDPYSILKVTTDIKDVGETITTTTTFPRLYLGVEAKIKDCLIGRVGANRAYQTRKTETKPAQGDAFETSFQTSLYNVSFGLGIKLGKFLIDLDINDGMFFEGPNLISGQMRDLANTVSVSYLFSNDEKE
jgi:hypothetical protein